MQTLTNHVCSCGGEFQPMDASGHSFTAVCETCQRGSLIIEHPNFGLVIPLADFHLKRGDEGDQRPLRDLGMATRLVECLVYDQWPSSATIVDFGIESRSHLGALQHAVRAGITAYDLDRVLGDGPAITALVRGVPGQPYRYIEFETAYDAFAGKLSWTD